MRKVALHGSYFGYNFGDTLLCALFCHWLRTYSDIEVTLPLASRRNLKLIGADRRGLLRFLACSDLIFCGGGYFGDSGRKNLKWTVRNYLRHFVLAELAVLLRKDVYILGTGAGPLSSGFLRSRLKRLMAYAKCVIVRDQESKDFLTTLGVTRPIVVDVDAVMYLDRKFLPPSSAESGHLRREAKKILAVHLTSFDAPHWEKMADAIAAFVAGSNVEILLITDSQSRTRKLTLQDKASSKLKELIPSATQISYSGNPTDLCELIDSVDLVVTNKLHVGIVGVVLGKQVISLPQHVKTPRFYRQLGLSDICVVENQPERLEELLTNWQKEILPRAVLAQRENVYLKVLSEAVGGDPATAT